MSGSGTLGFLLSASYGPATGTGTITYTDGSTQSYTLTSPDWFSTTPPSGGALAISSAYQNRQGNTTYAGTGNIFSETVPLTAGKTVATRHPAARRGAHLRHRGPAHLRHRLHRRRQRRSAVRRYRGGGPGHGAGGELRHRRAGRRLQRHLRQRHRQQLPLRRGGPGDLHGHRLRRTTSAGPATGQWFKYTVNVATAGTYTVSFRVASPNGVTDALHIANSAGTNLSGAITVPDTGGWQTWATVTATVTLPAGRADADPGPGQRRLEHPLPGLRRRGGPTTNLALNQPVTASSDYQSYVPANVTDGNTSTYWESADGAAYPQTIAVNLGSSQSIGSITLDLPPAPPGPPGPRRCRCWAAPTGRPSARSWPRPGTRSTRPPVTR